MHRRIPIVIAVLFILGIGAWSVAQAQFECINCVYVPLIRAEIHPTEIPTVTPQPTAIPPSPTLHVRSSRMYTNSSGTLYVVGEVVNGTTKPAFLVKVIAKFYDGFGTFVATEDTYAYLDRTDPGQLSPFRIILSNPPPGIVRADFTVTASASSFLAYVPATIVSNRTRDNAGQEIFGEVRNDQSRDVKSIQMVATFYDGAGNVYDVDWSYADISPLAPGALSTYKISTFDKHLIGLPYALQAQGYLAP